MQPQTHPPAIAIPPGFALVATSPGGTFAVNTLVTLYYLRSTRRFHVYRNSAEELHMHVPIAWHSDGKPRPSIRIHAQAPFVLSE